jgi:adenylate kinase family enzyme
LRRIAVFGCAGSGKTTLARALGERLGLPVIHVDSVYWRGRDGRFGAEWPGIHGELIAGDAWIIDGMKPGVLGDRLERADMAIFLDVPRRTCYRGLVERRLALRGGVRPEIGAYDRIDRALLRWIWRFPSEVRPGVLEHLQTCSCDVVSLSSRADVRRFLGGLPAPTEAVADRHVLVTEA